MKAEDWDDAILGDHRSHMDAGEGRRAFDLMVTEAAELRAFKCRAAWQGVVRVFHYDDVASGERPYAFIVNRTGLLFYVRKPGLARVRGGYAALKRRFQSVNKNAAGEWTVRIEDSAEGRSLSALLFSTSSRGG